MKKIEVREGKITWVVGIGTILVGISLILLYLLYPDDSIAVEVLCCLVAAAMIFSGFGLCMDAHNRKLVVEDMKLQYTNWYGKQTNFTLDEIGYCKTAFVSGSRDYLKVYNLLGNKLCKLEYHMHDCFLFLQYLADNHVKIDSMEASKEDLHLILDTEAVCAEKIADTVNTFYDEAREQVREWTKKNKKFGAEWKMGIACYLEDELLPDKQLWEQKSIRIDSFQSLPEGYMLVMEGYLLKNGEYVLNRRNQTVGFLVPIIQVTKSMQIGENLKIRYYKSSMVELSEQLNHLTYLLPRNRYHTENLILQHELKDRIG